MKQNSPRFYKILRIAFLVVGLMFSSFNGFAQSIGNVSLSENNVCTGNNLQVSFRATNGFFSRYTSNSTYIIAIGLYNANNQSFNPIYQETFQSTQPFPGGWLEFREFSRPFNIPSTLPPRNDYQILVSSINPDVRTTGGLSEIISISSAPQSPTINAISPICTGQTLQLNASNIPGASYSWTGPNGFTSTAQNPMRPNATAVMAGTYTVTATVNGCSSNPASTTVVINNPTTNYSETEFGNNSWIGHIYDGTNRNRSFNQNFTNYLGAYTEALSFDQNFGGDATNFRIGPGNCTPSVFTETFAVRYRMTSSLVGLYALNIGSDDGSRLSVDGSLIYDDWNDHAYRNQNILVNLTGSSSLVMDYYENSGQNRINVGSPVLLIENVLSNNINQTLSAPNDTPLEISGDEFSSLPTGINRINTGYQWVYSMVEGGPTTIISGATASTFTPNSNVAPFDSPGTYYIYRIATLRGTNTGQNFTTSIKSNPATIIIDEFCTEEPTLSLSAPSTVCEGQINVIGSFTGVAPWEIFASINGRAFNLTIDEREFNYPIWIQQNTNIEIISITDANGCQNDSPNESVFIEVINDIENNIITGNQEFCGELEASLLTGENLGEAYTYTWEKSTTNATTGFTEAPGSNNEVNYDPGTISETSWFRRKVSVQNCSENISNVLEITINSELINNHISLFHGNSGSIQEMVEENQDLSITAPNGTVFTYVEFASYGTPTNNDGFSIDENCHATTSQSVTEAYILGENSAIIPATNGIFTDPCVGTFKRLYVKASYAEAFCKGSDPGSITGTSIEGNNITYRWELSTEGPESGFSPAPGNNTQRDYNPGVLNQEIWVRRIVNSGSCRNESPILYIPIADENIWTGSENANWNNPANWSCRILPTLQTDVKIPTNLASNNYPVINLGNNGLVKNLTIENNATVEINDNLLRIAGSFASEGIVNTINGAISFQGTSAQNLPAGALVNNRIKDLILNNPAGLSSEGTLELTGKLLLQNGNFYTNDDFTLISDETQTALIDGSGSGQVIGQVKMQRYLDNRFGYKFFSSPFQNSKVGDFEAFMDLSNPVTNFPHFYRYDENRRVDSLDQDASGWEKYINAENALNTSEGYAVNFGASTDALTIELNGDVTNGPIAPRELLNHHREYTKGFHLVGNPYPSPIDWNAAQGWTKINIDDAIYFFTAGSENQYTGTYTAFINDISTEDSLADGRSSNIIPSMQGFFIKVSDSESGGVISGSFGMDNRVRVADFDQPFLRSRIAEAKSLIRLNARFASESKNDQMVIYFSNYASAGFEKDLDAHKLMNTDPAVPNFYNLTNTKKELAINAIPYPEARSYNKIPLGIKAGKAGEMIIDLSRVENLDRNFNIYLIDHLSNKVQNLRKKSQYKFSVKEGTHNSRFELMFSEEEINSPAIAFNELFDVEVRNGEVIVNLNLEMHQEGILRASTISGQLLQQKPGKGQEQVIFDGINSDGVYIINLRLGKENHSKKVLIKK
ncbi:hypothetical protein [Salegentibacter sp. HM20]